MKKIYSHEITISQSFNEGSGEYIYEVKKEGIDCEYSEEWVKDNDDPIKEYVENAIENVYDDSFSELGYTWDENANINFSSVSFNGASHILFKDGAPVELYYVE